MKLSNIVLSLGLVLSSLGIKAQLYFPPIQSGTWDTMDYSDLNWCQTKVDSLYNFLEVNSTKGFVLLKDGRIVLEQYFNGHAQLTNWYWASAGKTLTAFMVGMAQQESFINLSDMTAIHLGQGWTNTSPAQESEITIRHQLNMTTGLDDGVPEPGCTIDTCLEYLADAGSRWAYHNAPYTLLDQVIENATGQTLNAYSTQKVKNPIGMNGAYITQGYNKVFYSTTRSMARFGLLVLNKGNWDGNQILTDTDYFDQMVNTSQNLNESYGYLWWLNGKSSFMIPQTQIVFVGSMFPNAPDDTYAALGKNGQFINVVPSRNLVWIRMGEAPTNSPVPFTLNDDIWKHINELSCTSSSTEELNSKNRNVYPNPIENYIYISSNQNLVDLEYKLYSGVGNLVKAGRTRNKIDASGLSVGMYYLIIFDGIDLETVKIVKK